MFQGRKLVTMLVSLLAALLLWLYVVTTVAPETSTRVSNIPINIDGTIVLEQRGLIITDQDISEMTLELSASRVNVSKLNSTTIRISADASRIREPGTFALDCSVTFPDTVRSGAVDLIRKSSDTVTITVAKLVSKPVPVVLDWSGSVKEGFVFEAESAVLEPEEITIVGPDYEVNRVEKASVRYDVSALEQTEITTASVVFLDAEGEEVELSAHTTVGTREVSMTLPVLRTKEITLTVEKKTGGGVGEDNAQVTLEPATIRVKGDAEVIEALDDSYTIGSIDLSVIKDHDEFTFALALPAGVIVESGETEVQASVDIVGVYTDLLPVSDIRIINAPEGCTAEASARTVQVMIRGSHSDIYQIKRNKNNGVYILVDLQNYTQTGAFTVPGRVVNENQPQIGVMETVEVGVIISAEETPED